MSEREEAERVAHRLMQRPLTVAETVDSITDALLEAQAKGLREAVERLESIYQEHMRVSFDCETTERHWLSPEQVRAVGTELAERAAAIEAQRGRTT